MTPPSDLSPYVSRNDIARIWASGGGYIDGANLPFSPRSNAICGIHG